MSTNDFRDQLLRGFWHDLKAHLERDAIIVVESALDLATVADHVSRDQVSKVQGWLNEGQIAKPTAHQIETWNGLPTKEFQFLIVQPFVLVQEMTELSGH